MRDSFIPNVCSGVLSRNISHRHQEILSNKKITYEGLVFRPHYPEILEDDDLLRQDQASAIVYLWKEAHWQVGKNYVMLEKGEFAQLVRKLMVTISLEKEYRFLATIRTLTPGDIQKLNGKYCHVKDVRYVMCGALQGIDLPIGLAMNRDAIYAFQEVLRNNMIKLLMEK